MLVQKHIPFQESQNPDNSTWISFSSSWIISFFWSWRGLFRHIGLDILCKSENIWPFRWENQTAVFDQNICPWLSAPTTRCQVGDLLLLSGWDKYLLWHHFIKTTGSLGKSKSKSGKLLNSDLYHEFFFLAECISTITTRLKVSWNLSDRSDLASTLERNGLNTHMRRHRHVQNIRSCFSIPKSNRWCWLMTANDDFSQLDLDP